MGPEVAPLRGQAFEPVASRIVRRPISKKPTRVAAKRIVEEGKRQRRRVRAGEGDGTEVEQGTRPASEQRPAVEVQTLSTQKVYDSPYHGLDAILDIHQAEFQFTKKGEEVSALPPGVAPPARTGQSIGERLIREQTAAAGLPAPTLPRSAFDAPYAHETVLDPRVAMAMARTRGPSDEALPFWQRKFKEGVESLKEAFIASFRLRGTQRAGEQGKTLNEHYAVDRDILRQMQGLQRSEREVALSSLEHILGKNMNPRSYDLLATKLSLDEAFEALTRGEAAAFPGIPKAELMPLLKQQIDALEPFMKFDQVATRSYQRLLEMHREIGNELATRGLIDGQNLRQFYMHHQVLDFMRSTLGGRNIGLQMPNLKRFFEGKDSPQKVKGLQDFTPPQLKAREGRSIRDISRDLLSVEFRYLSTTLEAIKRFDLLREIGERNHIVNRPKAGYEAIAGQIQRQIEAGEQVEIPTGYIKYDLRSGFGELNARTAAERVFNASVDDLAPAMAKEMAKSLGVREADAYRYFMNLQRPGAKIDGKNVVIIPEELALTLRDAAIQRSKISDVLNIVEPVTRFWKNLVLHKTFLQYNLRNFVGDFEKDVAQFGLSNMTRPELWKDAYGEIVQAYGHRNLTPFMQKMQELNVTSSGRTAVEIAKVRDISQFRSLVRGPSEGLLTGRTAKEAGERIWNLWYRGLPRLSAAREDFLRIYIAKLNIQRMAEGKAPLTGVVNIEGFDLSKPDMQLRVAAKIARESLIDYGDFTPFENKLRNSLFPFYAWAKGNTFFWPKAISKAVQGAIRPSDVAAVAAFKGFTFMTTALIAARVWNDFVMGDAERSLPEHLQRSNHIIIPDPEVFAETGEFRPMLVTDKQGKTRVAVASVPDALDDALEWAGLHGVVPELKHLFTGRMGMREYLTRRREDAIFRDGFPFPSVVSGLANLAGPVFNAPVTALTGKVLFPDPLRPREVLPGDRPREVASQLGLSGFNLPTESLLSPGASPSTKVFDPLAQAGFRQVVAGEEDTALREARIRTSNAQREINELTGQIRRIRGGVSQRSLTQQERDKEAERLMRQREKKIREAQKLLERFQSLGSRAQRINLER